MNCDYEIFPEKRLIFMRYAGVFTFGQLKATAERLWGDKRYSRSYNGVIDLTDLNLGVARQDFQALLEFVAGHKATTEGRWAAVAASPLATACGMLYKQMLARRHTFEVFSTFHRAGAFVGVHLEEERLPIKASAAEPERPANPSKPSGWNLWRGKS